MGKRGPKPKRKKAVEAARVETLEPPEHLGQAGRDLFLWACNELAAQGRLTSDCLPALTHAGEALDMVRAADKDIRTYGICVETERGIVRNPATITRSANTAELHKWLNALMLTPQTRAGLTVTEKPGEEDAFDKFQKQFAVIGATG